MKRERQGHTFPAVGDGSGLEESARFHREELQLALRNRGLPLEAMRYPITPTGLHYLLIHYDIPAVDVETWRLEVGGEVANPLSLSLEEVRRRPARTIPVTLECAGNGRALLAPRRISQPWLLEAIGTAEWTGTPLRGLLAEAGVRDEAVEILFTGLDRGVEGGEVQDYQRSLRVEDASREEVLLVYEMNGEPLPPQHGFPLRLIVPGWYGMASVKWLGRVEAISTPFKGFQMTRAYRYVRGEGDPGEPVTEIRVRAMMIPPGVPDFMTRDRLVQAGPVTLRGRAWAGRREVSKVEVSADGGETWGEAALEAPVSPFAWRGWRYEWQAAPGAHVLCVRATDEAGDVQPMAADWNAGGYGNNGAQRVAVVVEA